MSVLPAHAPPDVVEAFNRLTDKQRAYALALPTAATQEAAMLAAGYAKQTARKTAATVAQHPDVQTVVAFIVRGAIAETQDSLERLIREACHVALVDPLDAFDAFDNLKPLREWPENLRRALSSIEIDALFEGQGKDRTQVGQTKKVKFWNKLDAIEKIAKMKGFLQPEKVEHTHRIAGMGDLLKELNGAGTGPGPG